MKKVKFGGLRPKGTLNPRRLWRPGETVEVEDNEAEALLRDPEFQQVKTGTRRRRTKSSKAKGKGE
jgi:hypothetical protein